MGKKEDVMKMFPEIKIEKPENQEKLEEVPAEVIAQALREMLNKEDDRKKKQ